MHTANLPHSSTTKARIIATTVCYRSALEWHSEFILRFLSQIKFGSAGVNLSSSVDDDGTSKLLYSPIFHICREFAVVVPRNIPVAFLLHLIGIFRILSLKFLCCLS